MHEALGGEHHYPPLPLSLTEEEVGGKEGGVEEEKTPEQTPELLDKCKAMEEGNFDDASDCFSHSLEIRVPHHGELPPYCARTLHGYGDISPCKAQKMDPSGNVLKNAPNEESVKYTVTTCKDDPGSSEASSDKHGDSDED